MKSIKKILSLVFLLVIGVLLVACTDKDKPPVVTPPPATDIDKALDVKWDGKFANRKVYLTCCGQSDISIIEACFRSAGIDSATYTTNNMLNATDINDAEVPVVILVVGASSKGLGSAGVNVESETARASAFARAAEQGKIELLVAHVGGTSRRGATSDPIIKAITSAADLLLVVEGGNNDNYFTNTASANSIDLYLYSKSSKLVDPFKTLFGVAV